MIRSHGTTDNSTAYDKETKLLLNRIIFVRKMNERYE